MDKNYKMTFRLDTFVQGTLMLFLLACGLFGLLGNDNAMITGLFLLFPLGVWQVSSGILFSILLRDKKRLLYLFSVIGFFTTMYIPTFFNIEFLGSPGAYAALPLMTILAGYYFTLTMKDMVVTNSDYINREV